MRGPLKVFRNGVLAAKRLSTSAMENHGSLSDHGQRPLSNFQGVLLISYTNNDTFSPCLIAHTGLSTRVIPLGQLHGAVLVQVLVHIICVPQQMRLVAPALLQTLKLGLVEVVLENGLVVRVRALVDDDPGALTGRHATDVGETLLSDDDIKIVLGLVDVRYLGHDARHSGGVVLRWAGGGGVHDGVLGGTQEVGGTSKTVQNARAHDAGGVGVGVDVNFDRGVHAGVKLVQSRTCPQRRRLTQ